MPRGTRAAWFLTLALFVAASALVAAPAAKRMSFDIPATGAIDAFKQFAAQSGTQVLYAADLVEGVKTPALKGQFTPREAIDRLLVGTELAAQQADNGAFAVRKEPGEPKNAQRAALATSERPETGEPPKADAPIELSPFEVRADQDKGYYGANTMSGTRLNSRLDDLAASITVVTKQQMLDTAAVDINDVFLYEMGTEGTGQFTGTSEDLGGPGDGAQGNPEGAHRIRGLNGSNQARGNFAALNRIPIDSYNIDAVEISRGPNSSIFGLGNGSGTVNIRVSQARLDREASQFTVRTDSEGSFRSSFDLNRPLGKTLGVRLLGVYDDKAYARKPSKDITRRGTVAFTFQPFSRTKIRGSYESYHGIQRRPNFITPRDGITPWIAAGRPTWDPVTFTAKRDGVPIGAFTIAQNPLLPAGLWAQGRGASDQPHLFFEPGGAEFFTVARLTTTANPYTVSGNARYIQTGPVLATQSASFPLFTVPGISDQSLYDWTSVNSTARNYSKTQADIYTLEAEQFFINTPTHILAASAGWYREDLERRNSVILSGGAANNVVIDVNERLLDGTPNPYFLRPYISATLPTSPVNDRPQLNDNARAQLAYQVDFSEHTGWRSWLGRHAATAYGEFRDLESVSINYRQAIIDDHAWQTNTNRTLREATYRYYVGDNQGFDFDHGPAALYGIAPDQTLYWRNGVTGQWITEPVVFGEPARTQVHTDQEIRTRGLAMQNFLFKDRLVTTFGWRRDKTRSRSPRDATIDPATGFLHPDPTFPDWDEKQGTTKTQGGVLRPFKGWGFLDRRADEGSFVADALRKLAVHYNESDSFTPAATATNLFGETIPLPAGEGKDYGVSLTLFSDKLHLRVNKYETLQINNRAGNAGTFSRRLLGIDFPDGNASNLFDFASSVVTERFLDQGITPTPEQVTAEAEKFMQLPAGSFDQFQALNFSGGVQDTRKVESKGWEIEAHFNPTRHWTLKFNATQTKSIESDVAPAVQRYLDMRLPVWQGIKDDDGNFWFGPSGSEARLASNVAAPLALLRANEGKSSTQVREWRFNATTSYQLAGLGGDGRWLKNLTVGGAVRWEDEASIGYLGGPPDADGVIRTLDANRPVFDKARAYFDAFASYRLRLFDQKVSARLQLNVRNMFEDGRLQTIRVNPDGQASTFRIIDPRQFILTVTFDL